MASSSTLLAAAGGAVPGAAAQQLLSASGKALADVQLLGEPGAAGAGNYGGALLALGGSGCSPAFLGTIAKLLQPGAPVLVHPGTSSEEAVRSVLTLGGFVDVADGPAAPLLSCRAPAHAVGAKSAIALKPKAKQQPAAAAAAAAAAAPASAWVVSADDDLDGGAEELVDEDELLTEEDKRPAAPAPADDCEVGASGRKACKNCSCGRAEAEARGERVTLTQDMLENPTSACGNCYLGDAFRCAGCPYRGLPAFEKGKKIELPPDFLTADA